MHVMKNLPIVCVLSVSLGGLESRLARAEAPASSESDALDAKTSSAKAGDLRQEAEERFFEEDYDAAIALFERAHALDSDPTDLFNIGRIYEQEGKLKRALEHYEQFAELPGLSLQERAAAAERIQVLRVLVAKDADAPPPAVPPRREDGTEGAGFLTGGTTSMSSDKPPGRPMVIAGASLLAVGAVAGLAGGVTFGMAARRRANQVKDLANGSNPGRLTLAEAEALDASGRDFSTLQITFVAVGGALALGGAALLAAGLVRNRRVRLAGISPMIDSKMVALSGAWRF